MKTYTYALFLLVSIFFWMSCSSGEEGDVPDIPTDDDDDAVDSPVLEMVQPASPDHYLDVDQPVMVLFNQWLSPDKGYLLSVDGSPPVDRTSNLFTVNDQYNDVPDVILDEHGQPIAQPYGSLTFTPLGVGWRHDTEYKLTIAFTYNTPPPVELSFKTRPAPPYPELMSLAGQRYFALSDEPGRMCAEWDCKDEIGFKVHEIDQGGVIFQINKFPDGKPGLLPKAQFKSGGVFFAETLVTEEDGPYWEYMMNGFSISDSPPPDYVGMRFGFLGELLADGALTAMVWMEFPTQPVPQMAVIAIISADATP